MDCKSSQKHTQRWLQGGRCHAACARTMKHTCASTAECAHKLLQSTSGSPNTHSEYCQQLAVAGCTFSLLHCLLASVAGGSSDTPAGSTVRTCDFVIKKGDDSTNVDGNYYRAMELIVRFDVALSLVQRRLQAQLLSCFLEDFNQPSSSAKGIQLSEHAFLCALLLTCPSEPASLALPLSVLRTLLSSLTTPGSASATCTIIPPACVQLLVSRGTTRQQALPAARALAEKMCSWRCSSGEAEDSLPSTSVFYVSGTVALYMHADGVDKSDLAGASMRPFLDVVRHHCSPQWAPLLSCFATLEQMMPARCVINYPQRHVTDTTVDMVRCTSRGCSGDAVRSFAAVAVSAWWLLESSARPQVSAMLLARLCEEDARITASTADALQVIDGTSDTPLQQQLVAQPGTLQQISSQLTNRPNVRVLTDSPQNLSRQVLLTYHSQACRAHVVPVYMWSSLEYRSVSLCRCYRQLQGR